MNKKRKNGKRERINREQLFELKEKYTSEYVMYLIGKDTRESIEEEYNKKPL